METNDIGESAEALGLRERPVKQEIPSATLRAGSSLRLKNGCAQDDNAIELAVGVMSEIKHHVSLACGRAGGHLVWTKRGIHETQDSSLRD